VECELRGVGAAQGLEGKGVVGKQAAAPGGPGVEQLRPGKREQEHRQALQSRGEELDQVEEHRVGPVDVLEHERGGLVPRAGPDEDAHGLEEAVAVGRGRLGLEAEEDRQVPGHDGGLVLADEPLYQRAQLSRRHCDVVAVEDPGELLDLRREGAVGAALAIREAAAADARDRRPPRWAR